MSKAYLLVILLFAASFTGCMGGSDDNTETDTTIDDETKQEDNTKQEEETEQEEEEEELIDPVGEPIEDSSTGCNCTLIFTDEDNITVIVEDTSYDPEHFSSVWLSNQPLGYWNETGVFIKNSDGNDFGRESVFRGFFNKTGNNVQITPLPYTNDSFAPFTLDDMGRGNTFWYQITIYGPDGLVWQDFVKFLYYDCDYWNEDGQYCYDGQTGSSGPPYENEYFFHIVDIELPWEPLGFSLRYTNNYDAGTPGDAQVTRSF